MGARIEWTVLSLSLSVGRGRRRNGRKGYGNDRKVLMRGKIIVTRFRCNGRTRGSTAYIRLQGRNDEMKQLRNPRGRAVSYPSRDLSTHRPTFKWIFFFILTYPFSISVFGVTALILSHRRMVSFFFAYPAYSMQPWYALELLPFFLLAGLALACTAHLHTHLDTYISARLCLFYFVGR